MLTGLNYLSASSIFKMMRRGVVTMSEQFEVWVREPTYIVDYEEVPMCHTAHGAKAKGA